ncbi:hypothetical protein ACN4EG_06090 [Alkalinema pantanalense CENA528]|uniref:hypothetical protein n=1 Tax=Alkalinema pantanalense TaxID=1620705 RepID=UPI003D6F0B16
MAAFRNDSLDQSSDLDWSTPNLQLEKVICTDKVFRYLSQEEIEQSPEIEEFVTLFLHSNQLPPEQVVNICQQLNLLQQRLQHHLIVLFEALAHIGDLQFWLPMENQNNISMDFIRDTKDLWEKTEHLHADCEQLIELTNRYAQLQPKLQQGRERTEETLEFFIDSIRYINKYLMEQVPNLMFGSREDWPQNSRRLYRYINELHSFINRVIRLLQGHLRDRLPSDIVHHYDLDNIKQLEEQKGINHGN